MPIQPEAMPVLQSRTSIETGTSCPVSEVRITKALSSWAKFGRFSGQTESKDLLLGRSMDAVNFRLDRLELVAQKVF
jgi:hypothetical protein